MPSTRLPRKFSPSIGRQLLGKSHNLKRLSMCCTVRWHVWITKSHVGQRQILNPLTLTENASTRRTPHAKLFRVKVSMSGSKTSWIQWLASRRSSPTKISSNCAKLGVYSDRILPTSSRSCPHMESSPSRDFFSRFIRILASSKCCRKRLMRARYLV